MAGIRSAKAAAPASWRGLLLALVLLPSLAHATTAPVDGARVWLPVVD